MWSFSWFSSVRYYYETTAAAFAATSLRR